VQSGPCSHRAAGLWLAPALPLTAKGPSLLWVSNEGMKGAKRGENGKPKKKEITAFQEDRGLTCQLGIFESIADSHPQSLGGKCFGRKGIRTAGNQHKQLRIRALSALSPPIQECQYSSIMELYGQDRHPPGPALDNRGERAHSFRIQRTAAANITDSRPPASSFERQIGLRGRVPRRSGTSRRESSLPISNPCG